MTKQTGEHELSEKIIRLPKVKEREGFRYRVRPRLPTFDLDDCIELIRGIETNGQTWERRGAYTDHRELRARALEIDPAFNPAQYAVFNRHLN